MTVNNNVIKTKIDSKKEDRMINIQEQITIFEAKIKARYPDLKIGYSYDNEVIIYTRSILYIILAGKICNLIEIIHLIC